VNVETLLCELAESGIELRPEGDRLRFRGPKGALSPELRGRVIAHRAELLAALAGEGGERTTGTTAETAGFELTDLQRAYWLGAQGLYPLSATAHVWHEYHVELLDVDALHAALTQLVARHEVLRTVVRDDGTQATLAAVPLRRPRCMDLRELDAERRGAALEHQRNAVVDDLPDVGSGPPLAVRVARLSDGHRIVLAVRLSALDGQSLRRFLAELTALAYCPQQELPAVSGTYRDLVVSAMHPPARRHGAALRHWAERARDLPGSVSVPLRDRDRLPAQSRFVRRHVRLPADVATALRTQSSRHGVTVSAALCTAYAATLRRWSSAKDFTLNVLSSLRPITGERDDVLGNLGTTVLVACPDRDDDFLQQALAMQEQLYAAVAHDVVSGMEVLRRFSPAHLSTATSFMPFVFAPGRGITEAAAAPEMTAPGWRLLDAGINTPQVLLDHQVYGDGDELVLNWDAVTDAFPDGLLDEAFAYYRDLLRKLAEPGMAWDRLNPATLPLPVEQLRARRRANHTAHPVHTGLLQDGFRAVAERTPERPAILDGEVTLRYGEVSAQAAALARRLKAAGVRHGDLVAVRAARRWQQVVAVLGVLEAGGAYLPVDVGWPAERVAWLLEQSGARATLAGSDEQIDTGLPVIDIGPGPDLPVAPVRSGCAPDDLAYVIYTSGSTGRPKGVAITHRAADNTVRDILQRYGVTGDDRTLCLSALNFDLSVFDLFGLLGVGGAVVGVDPGPPDPAAWAQLVRARRVTVWNSVPAIMELTLDHLGDTAPDYLGGLRLVMLSGDWIPVSLPARIRALGPDVRLVALGGATEASIWSNAFPVGELDPGWPSVPYGYPLTNQRMHVLDRHLADVPTWVPGDLYIAGTGLASGYHNDPEKTAAAFLLRPDGTELMYRTGDLARYRPGGCLEFLGRADNQVKIDGYRIELGEVESTLLRAPGVKAAATVVVDAPGRGRRLVAFVVPASGTTPEPDAVRAALAAWLPAYMVPREVHVLDRLPLTAIGKVDRSRLAAEARAGGPVEHEVVAPRTDVETVLAELWSDVLGTDAVSVTDDFFAVGGSSRSAVQLVNRIHERLDPLMSLRELFENPTLAGQAARIGQQSGRTEPALVRLRSGHHGPLVLVHPIGGGVLCYRELVDALPADVYVLGAQHAGLDGGLPSGSVPQLAERYARQVENAAPGGDVVLAGWSMGGLIALETARLLLRRGTVGVSRVVVLDGWAVDPAGVEGADPGVDDVCRVAADFLHDLVGGGDVVSEPVTGDADTVLLRGLERLRSARRIEPGLEIGDVERLFDVYRSNYDALRRHRVGLPGCPVDLFVAHRATATRARLVPLHEVLDTSSAQVRLTTLDADHFTIVTGEAAELVAEHLGAWVRKGQLAESGSRVRRRRA